MLDELFHSSVGRVLDSELVWEEIAQGTVSTKEAQWILIFLSHMPVQHYSCIVALLFDQHCLIDHQLSLYLLWKNILSESETPSSLIMVSILASRGCSLSSI